MDIAQLAPLIAALLALASFIHGYSGFGMGLTSFSLLSLLGQSMEQVSIVVTINALIIMAVLLVISGLDSRIDWREAWLIVGGCAVGMPLGYAFLAAFGDLPVFRLLLGLLLIYFAWLGLKMPIPDRRFPAWAGILLGVGAGFIGGAFISGGPPIVLYLYAQSDDPRETKATLQFIFVLTLIYRLILIGAGTGYTWPVIRLSLLVAPAALVAICLGHRLSKKASAAGFKRWAYLLIAVLGVLVVAKAIGDGFLV